MTASPNQIHRHRKVNIGTTGSITPTTGNVGDWVLKDFASKRAHLPPRLPHNRLCLCAHREPATTGAAVADVASDTNVTGPVAPVPWLGVQSFPELPPVQQAVTAPDTRIASAFQTNSSSSNLAAASVSDRSPPEISRTEEAKHPMTVRSASSAAHALASSEIDHTFAFLMIMFAMLAVAGPTLHYAERRRAREDQNHQPPRWTHVVALNAPTPRIREPLPREPAGRPAPIPPIPPDRTERLAQALQQLVDRLQTSSSAEPPGTAAGPVRRANLQMRRSTR